MTITKQTSNRKRNRQSTKDQSGGDEAILTSSSTPKATRSHRPAAHATHQGERPAKRQKQLTRASVCEGPCKHAACAERKNLGSSVRAFRWADVTFGTDGDVKVPIMVPVEDCPEDTAATDLVKWHFSKYCPNPQALSERPKSRCLSKRHDPLPGPSTSGVAEETVVRPSTSVQPSVRESPRFQSPVPSSRPPPSRVEVVADPEPTDWSALANSVHPFPSDDMNIWSFMNSPSTQPLPNLPKDYSVHYRAMSDIDFGNAPALLGTARQEHHYLAYPQLSSQPAEHGSMNFEATNPGTGWSMHQNVVKWEPGSFDGSLGQLQPQIQRQTHSYHTGATIHPSQLGSYAAAYPNRSPRGRETRAPAPQLPYLSYPFVDTSGALYRRA